jgi:hypothetical protein
MFNFHLSIQKLSTRHEHPQNNTNSFKSALAFLKNMKKNHNGRFFTCTFLTTPSPIVLKSDRIA